MFQGNPPSDAGIDLAEFGVAEAHFRVGGYRHRLLQVGGLIGILAGIGFLCLVAYFGFFGARGPQRGDLSSLLHGVVFAVTALVAGEAALSRSRNYRGLQVLVCSRGLVCMRDNGIEQVHWESIRCVQRVPRSATGVSDSWRPSVQLVLERIDGPELAFDETLQNLGQLREMVEEHTLDQFLARELERLRSGDSISFGQLTVSQEGIVADKAMLPWTRYGASTAERGQVSIYDVRGNSFSKVEIAAVPNVHVFLALAEFLGRTGKLKSISEGLSS
ncbi:MAG TPA: DUF6585 family protein [Gemmataceae bacterium]|nr:DUF6585 family protein [Gemmataceae bacterium]